MTRDEKRAARIVRLRREGKSFAEIARTVRRTRGQVQYAYEKAIAGVRSSKPRLGRSPLRKATPALSTRVDETLIRTRKASGPPSWQVLFVPDELVHSFEHEEAIEALLSCTIPGWSWEVDIGPDALDASHASAAHRACERGWDLRLAGRRATFYEHGRIVAAGLLVVVRFRPV
jgi:hypothetical protein